MVFNPERNEGLLSPTKSSHWFLPLLLNYKIFPLPNYKLFFSSHGPSLHVTISANILKSLKNDHQG